MYNEFLFFYEKQPKRCRIRRNATPFWLFDDKNSTFSLVFYKETFCATSVCREPLHSVGEQPSFVLKIR